MPHDAAPDQRVKKYYVDEAGDGVIFGHKGGDLLKAKEVQRYFMLGFVEVADETKVDHAFRELRQALLADPLFASIESMRPERKKTALLFHAKDDHAEVRAKVFELIRTFDFKFSATIRDMRVVRLSAQNLSAISHEYRYNPNDLYQYITLHQIWRNFEPSVRYEIQLSQRGHTNRTDALLQELKTLKAASKKEFQTGDIRIEVEDTRNSGCLQLVDYCLWALQRAYERAEIRFLHAIWDKVEFIYDDDDKNDIFGRELTRKNAPPTEEELKARWI